LIDRLWLPVNRATCQSGERVGGGKLR
jgi:hypothetical protein